ncbi:MAG: c-type cytochrome domain-containing protein, partial [Verrucomicrobiota bacterium]
MNDSDIPPRFASLVGKYVDESITAEELAELEHLLLGSSDARTEFYRQLETSVQLIDSAPEQSSNNEVIAFQSSHAGWFGLRQRWFLIGSAAAAAVVALFFLVSYSSPNETELPLIVERPSAAQPTPVEPEPRVAPEDRYEQTMAKIGQVGSQSRPPAKATPATAAGETLSYNRDIRPILSDRCFACHGPDANTREADLRLDTPEGAYAALDPEGKWHQIKPGEPETSEVFYRITTDDEDDMMPPPEAKLPR